MERSAQWVRAWKPEVPGIHEVFHARFVDHAYLAHTHDAWTVFTVDEGSIAYDLERRHRGVKGSKVTLLPPHVVHDGRPAASAGYRKRVLYVGTEVLGEGLPSLPATTKRARAGFTQPLPRAYSEQGRIRLCGDGRLLDRREFRAAARQGTL